MQIYYSFYLLFIKFPFNFPRLQNYYISSTPATFFAEKVINSLSTLHSTPYTGSSAAYKPTFLHKKKAVTRL